MVAPENLVDAVNRVKPRATLLLDTNTIMDAPKLDFINASGPFLLVVPQVVDNELMSVRRGGKSEQSKRKASRAWSSVSKLYKRGNPARGIDLGNNLWLVTASSPRLPDSRSTEEEQILGNLGKVDAALLRLASACALDCPATSTLLVTGDRNLTHVARAQGLIVCQLSNLRSSEALEQAILCARPSGVSDVDFSSLLDLDEERTVKISMTLEEVRSEGAALVARGSGRLGYDETQYPFRWTFPYTNLATYKNLGMVDIHQLEENAAMPLENLDFMGADEQIPESLKNVVCGILEGSSGWSGTEKSLQSPLTQIRFNLEWHSAMGQLIGQPCGCGFETRKRLISPEKVETYEQLSSQHDRHLERLKDGTSENFGRAYRSMFQLREALADLLGWDKEYDPELGPWDLESALIHFLETALRTWPVGESIEMERIHRPFSWPEQGDDKSLDHEGHPGT